MKYVLFIYGSEAEHGQMSQEALQTEMQEYFAFNQNLINRGIKMSGESLQPTTTATTVHVRDGKTMTTDGPFAETKEQLAGFYVVEAKDLDEAIELAAMIPGARTGSVEVRPVWEFNG